MKIAFIQTYPIYHDFGMTVQKWLKLENRDKWMPAILAKEGYEVELWGVAENASQHTYRNSHFDDFAIKLFEVSKKHRHTKKDYSLDLIDYAKNFNADIYFLKGVDGGAGIKLLENHLLPHHKPFVFIIGGKFYNKYVPKANGIFYETPQQKQQLMHPGLAFIRSRIDESKLIFLPKSIATDHFKPLADIPKKYDIVSAGRLIPYYKNYDPLGQLSEELEVALIGGGPMKDYLHSKFPKLHLIGEVPHERMPYYLNQGRVFFHPSLRDFFPRVIPEAMAAGLPCIGFDNIISENVIPDNCGLRVDPDDFITPILKLMTQDNLLTAYAKNAREHVIKNYGIYSSIAPMLKMLKHLDLLSTSEEIYVE